MDSRLRSLLLASISLAALNAQGPAIVDGGVLNGASFAKGQALSPGSLVSIFGDNFGSDLASASTVPFSVALAGVSVTFNGIPAPLRDVVPGSPASHAQINAQIPWEALGINTEGAVGVVVTVGTATSPSQQLQLKQFSPGIFTIPAGAGNLIAVNADGSIAAPVGAIPGFNTHPAKIGDSLFFYANGLGPVDSPVANGDASLDKLRNTVTTPTIIIDGIRVTPLFSGLAPQFPGVNQINFTIPNGVRSGNVTVKLEIGGITTDQQATIAVQ